MTDELLETKESFVKRLDGTFEKYESIVLMRKDLEKMQATLQNLQDSGLRYETIILLMHDHTKIGKRTIKKVLEGLQEIPHKYFKEED
jgi:acetone carboxylase gamma subunit